MMIPYRPGEGWLGELSKQAVFCCTVDHVEVAIVPACLDSLLIGPYVLADEFFIDRRGPGRPRKITDAELVCLAVAQVTVGLPR
jgi:hypothetical protein